MALSQVEIDQYRQFAERLADVARAQTLPRFRAGVDVFNKAGIWYDPVTDADREAERVQRRTIKAAFPDHGILGEEFGIENEEATLRWVIDPIDGTRAFVCGVPSWVTLIAFEEDRRPVLGLIDQGFMDERWIGVAGATVYIRGGETQSCKTSGVTDISKARISTTDPRRTAYFTTKEVDAFERVAEQARLARFSLDAYAYALLAMGELDLVIEAGLKHHDYAALAPVVEGAGGVITNWRGKSFDADDRGRTLAAATPELHEEAMRLLLADQNF